MKKIKAAIIFKIENGGRLNVFCRVFCYNQKYLIRNKGKCCEKGEIGFMQRLKKIEDRIVYEDQQVIVCQKTAGIAVQNARTGVMDLECALKNYLAEKNSRQMPYLGIVHRLDQPVEGLLVFAKTKQAAADLSRQMVRGDMGKYYLAVTLQKPAAPEGDLEDYLQKDGKSNSSCVVKKGTSGAKKARLHYRVLQCVREEQSVTGEKYLISVKLETGRHHQIRVQLANAGIPLAGDRKYNGEEQTEFPLGLCAWRLEFQHPKTRKKMQFQIFPEGAAFQGFTPE